MPEVLVFLTHHRSRLLYLSNLVSWKGVALSPPPKDFSNLSKLVNQVSSVLSSPFLLCLGLWLALVAASSPCFDSPVQCCLNSMPQGNTVKKLKAERMSSIAGGWEHFLFDCSHTHTQAGLSSHFQGPRHCTAVRKNGMWTATLTCFHGGIDFKVNHVVFSLTHYAFLPFNKV